MFCFLAFPYEKALLLGQVSVLSLSHNVASSIVLIQTVCTSVIPACNRLLSMFFFPSMIRTDYFLVFYPCKLLCKLLSGVTFPLLLDPCRYEMYFVTSKCVVFHQFSSHILIQNAKDTKGVFPNPRGGT